MKTYEAPPLLTSTLDAGKLPASRAGRFTPAKSISVQIGLQVECEPEIVCAL
jgi:hypothetical protein